MKKILALMLALVLAMSLVACGGSEEAAAPEAVEEAAEEEAVAPEFDVTALVGNWTLVAATTPEGDDDMEAVMEIYEDKFDMEIREDGTITWYTGIADIEGGVVAIEDDGSAMLQFVEGDNVLQLAAIVDEGSLVLVDGEGSGYILEAK